MTDDEYMRRREYAVCFLGDDIRGWWMQHDGGCANEVGGQCDCYAPLWFSGARAVACVTPEAEVATFPLH